MNRLFTVILAALFMFSCTHLPAEADKIAGKPESVITELSIPTKEDPTLTAIGKRLARHSKNGEDYYQFKLASPSEINAFTLPGGYIYVLSGIVRILETEDELAALLAHEIAHSDMRHYAEQFDWKMPLHLFGTGLSLLTLGILPNPFMMALSRQNESEADRVGLELMVKAGFCAHGMRGLMAKLDAVASLGTPNRYVLSHPPANERLHSIDTMIATTETLGCEETPLSWVEILRIPP